MCVAATFLTGLSEKLKLPNFAVPDHFFGSTNGRVERIRDTLKNGHGQINIVNEQLMELAHGLLSAILIGAELFIPIGQSVSLAAAEWFLMSRHGECAEIQSLKRKVPDLGDIRDPSAFIKMMRDKGYQVMLNEVSTPNGKVLEVKVPERELYLMFVPPEVCQQSGRE